MDLYISEKIEVQEAGLMDKVALLMESQAKLQRIRIDRQVSILRERRLDRDRVKADVLRRSAEFSAILTGKPLIGPDQASLEIAQSRQISFENYLSNQLRTIVQLDTAMIEKERMLVDMTKEGRKLEVISEQMQRLSQGVNSRRLSADDQREVEELSDASMVAQNRFNADENQISTGVYRNQCIHKSDLIEKTERGCGISDVSELVYSHELTKPSSIDEARWSVSANNFENDSSITEISYLEESATTRQLCEDIDPQVEDSLDNLQELKDTINRTTSLPCAPSPCHSGDTVKAGAPHIEPSQRSITDSSSKRRGQEAQGEIQHWSEPGQLKMDALTITLPVQISEEQHPVDLRDTRGRIAWEDSFLTVSVSEQHGTARLELWGHESLRETLTGARRYFETELSELFNHAIVIKEFYST